MKNIRSNTAETGVVETLANLHRYSDIPEIIEKAELYLPIPQKEDTPDADSIANSLSALGKSRMLFLTPEIAVVEKLAKYGTVKQIVVCLPSSYDEDTCQRIAANMPQGVEISFIRENEIPHNFVPSRDAIVAFGFYDNGRGLILSSNYRMMERYKAFYGSRVLVNCGRQVSACRPVGWAPVNVSEFFNRFI